MNPFLIGVLILAAFAGGYVLAIYKGPTIDAEAGKIEHKGVEYIASWKQRLGGVSGKGQTASPSTGVPQAGAAYSPGGNTKSPVDDQAG